MPVHEIRTRPRWARAARGSPWPAGIWKCLAVPESFPASRRQRVQETHLVSRASSGLSPALPEPRRSPTLARRLRLASRLEARSAGAWRPHPAPYRPVPSLAGSWHWAAICFGQRLPRRTRTRPAGMDTPDDGVAPSQRPLSRRETMMSFVYAKQICKCDAMLERTICGVQCLRSRLLAASLTGEQKTGFEMGQSKPKKTPSIDECRLKPSWHRAQWPTRRHDGERGASGTVAVRDGARETDRRIFGRRALLPSRPSSCTRIIRDCDDTK